MAQFCGRCRYLIEDCTCKGGPTGVRCGTLPEGMPDIRAERELAARRFVSTPGANDVVERAYREGIQPSPRFENWLSPSPQWRKHPEPDPPILDWVIDVYAGAPAPPRIEPSHPFVYSRHWSKAPGTSPCRPRQ